MPDNTIDTIRFYIDQAGFEKGPRCGTSNFFTGWVINTNEANAIEHVRFTVNDTDLGTLRINHERPDLKKIYGKTMLGFWGPIMIPEKLFGSTLRVEAVAGNGMCFVLKEYTLEDVVAPEEREFARRHNLPDDMLRHLVVANIDPHLFIQRGKEGVQLIQRVLQKHRIDMHTIKNVLDFGVGCGRVMRWWEDYSSTISFWGTDINEQLIAWCRENIPFAKFSVNTLHPPLNVESNTFDLLYAFSIFTHLVPDTQSEWLKEFARILAPQRYALISVHGDKDAELLDRESREQYEQHGYVIISENAEGENMCATYQNKMVSERLFSAWFEVVDHIPASLSATSNQDLYLLRKK